MRTQAGPSGGDQALERWANRCNAGVVAVVLLR
jgi:hypothetical protein